MNRYRSVLFWAGAVLLLAAAAAGFVVSFGAEPFDRVETGMTVAEVGQILGGPGLQCMGETGPRAEYQQTLLWEAEGGEILVTFDEGRVVSKRFAADRYSSGRPRWSFRRALRRLGF